MKPLVTANFGKKMPGIVKTFSLALASYFSLTASAHAYLDPGTASLILQAIVGAVAAAMVTLTVYWQRTKQFVSRWFRKGTKIER